MLSKQGNVYRQRAVLEDMWSRCGSQLSLGLSNVMEAACFAFCLLTATSSLQLVNCEDLLSSTQTEVPEVPGRQLNGTVPEVTTVPELTTRDLDQDIQSLFEGLGQLLLPLAARIRVDSKLSLECKHSLLRTAYAAFRKEAWALKCKIIFVWLLRITIARFTVVMFSLSCDPAGSDN